MFWKLQTNSWKMILAEFSKQPRQFLKIWWCSTVSVQMHIFSFIKCANQNIKSVSSSYRWHMVSCLFCLLGIYYVPVKKSKKKKSLDFLWVKWIPAVYFGSRVPPVRQLKWLSDFLRDKCGPDLSNETQDWEAVGALWETNTHPTSVRMAQCVWYQHEVLMTPRLHGRSDKPKNTNQGETLSRWQWEVWSAY